MSLALYLSRVRSSEVLGGTGSLTKVNLTKNQTASATVAGGSATKSLKNRFPFQKPIAGPTVQTPSIRAPPASRQWSASRNLSQGMSVPRKAPTVKVYRAMRLGDNVPPNGK